jgi:hypothetical protein
MVVKATCQLRLLEVTGDVLVGHFLEAGLEKIDFLWCIVSNLSSVFVSKCRTSSSLQALPPPVDASLRFF